MWLPASNYPRVVKFKFIVFILTGPLAPNEFLRGASCPAWGPDSFMGSKAVCLCTAGVPRLCSAFKGPSC